MLNWTRRFLYLTSDRPWKTKLWILSMAYLPWPIFRVIWKGYEE